MERKGKILILNISRFIKWKNSMVVNVYNCVFLKIRKKIMNKFSNMLL